MLFWIPKITVLGVWGIVIIVRVLGEVYDNSVLGPLRLVEENMKLISFRLQGLGFGISRSGFRVLGLGSQTIS